MRIKLNENLKRLMLERKMNQTQLSKITGIAKSTLNGYLNSNPKSTEKIDIGQMKKIADALQTDFHDLLFGTPDPFSKASLPKEVLHELFSGDVRLTVHRIERK
jgi:transcriptional regulator with XRE-family HTH domain